MIEGETPDWLRILNEEDFSFLRRFLLHSGSLKKMASEYGVSYPTVRLRLDRLIQKVEVAEEAIKESPFERQLKLLLAEKSISAGAYRALLEAHELELKEYTNDTDDEQDEPK